MSFVKMSKKKISLKEYKMLQKDLLLKNTQLITLTVQVIKV